MNWQRIHTQGYYRLENMNGNLCDLTGRLIVNCTGVSVIDAPFRSHRPNGRHDYYLMYMACGELEAWSGDSEYRLTPGDMVIQRPEHPFGYQMTREERMVYLWVHFTGSEVGSLLNRLNLTPSKVYHIGIDEVVEEDFENLQRLFITRPPFYLEESASRLEILLTHIGRAACSAENEKTARLQVSLNHLNRHYAESLNLETLAGMEYLSVSRYSALFRQITGRSPQQYLIGLRLKNAHDLLLNTDLSISEVAHSVGYDDALYFSRLFRRHYGSAPRAARTKK